MTAVGVIGGATLWAINYFPKIGIFFRDRFDSLIARAIIREIAPENKDPENKNKDKYDLKQTITKLIISELNEQTSEMPQEIKNQTRALFDDALKNKVGPIQAGFLKLDSKNSKSTINVYWKKGHTTHLWVYFEDYLPDDCLRIVPDGGQTPLNIVAPLTKDFIIEDLLADMPPSAPKALGIEADAINAVQQPKENTEEKTARSEKGELNHVYGLTFTLGSKLKENKYVCRIPRNELTNKDALNPVDVSYFIATVPLVTSPWNDLKVE